MAEKKINSGLAIAAAIAVMGAALLHYLDIFTIDDWKELINMGDATHTDSEAEVHFIDVGQGDCALIISEGETLLIDVGERAYAENVCSYLQEHNIEKIDCMVFSHTHSDHMGGASVIVDNFDVGKIIVPKMPDDMTPTTKFYERFIASVEKKGLKLTAAKVGDMYEIGECDFEIIAPVEDYDDLNNFSVAGILKHGENSFLFTGDVEKEAEKDIIESGGFEDVDVYKAAHHGSTTSNCEEMLEITKPEIVVISCGAGNSYGHPHDETVESLNEYADNIYRTDIDGTVIITSNENGLSTEFEQRAE